MTRAALCVLGLWVGGCSALGLDDVGPRPCDTSAPDPTAKGHLCARLNADKRLDRDCLIFQCSADGAGCVLAPQDLDRDGHAAVGSACAARGTDCNDRDLATAPGADELCDGRDNDCDGVVDEDTAWTVSEERPLALAGEPSVSTLMDSVLAASARADGALELERIPADGEARTIRFEDGAPCDGDAKCSFDQLALYEGQRTEGFVARGRRGDDLTRLIAGTMAGDALGATTPRSAEVLAESSGQSPFAGAVLGSELHVAYGADTGLRIARRLLAEGSAFTRDGFAPEDFVARGLALGASPSQALLAYTTDTGIALACASATAGTRTRYRPCGTVELDVQADALTLSASAPPGDDFALAWRSAADTRIVRRGSAAHSAPPLVLATGATLAGPVLVSIPNREVPRWLVLVEDTSDGARAYELRSDATDALLVSGPASALAFSGSGVGPWRGAVAPSADTVHAVRGAAYVTLRCVPRTRL